LHQVDLQALTVIVAVGFDLLLRRQNRFGLAHLEDHIPLRDALHRRRDEFALAIHIFAINMFALNLFNALQNHLLRSLSGMRPKSFGVLSTTIVSPSSTSGLI